MTDHLHDPAQVGDLVVSTVRVKWQPPYELLRVASVDNDGWVTSVRSLDGRRQRTRGPIETVFLVRFRPEYATAVHLAVASVQVACAESIAAVKDVLRPCAAPPIHA